MTTITASRSTALAVLHRSSVAAQSPYIAKHRGTVTPSVRVGPAVGNALPTAAMDKLLFSRSNAAPLQRNFTQKEQDWFRSLGADSWEEFEVTKVNYSDEEFRARVLGFLQESGSEQLEGFNDALANGTLKIQRASDVPELALKTVNVTLFKAGSVQGGVSYDVANQGYIDSLRRGGTFASSGSIDGNDFVVSWAMPYRR